MTPAAGYRIIDGAWPRIVAENRSGATGPQATADEVRRLRVVATPPPDELRIEYDIRLEGVVGEWRSALRAAASNLGLPLRSLTLQRGGWNGRTYAPVRRGPPA